MANNETTPLLNNERITDAISTEDAAHLSNRLNIERLCALSLLWCIIASIIGYFITLFTTQSRYGFFIPEELAGALIFGGQMCFWVVIISILNLARLRRSKLELPWWINVIVDFFVVLLGAFTSLLYFVLNATTHKTESCYGSLPVDECKATANLIRTLGTFVMISVLSLSLTHAGLLYFRLQHTPQIIQPPSTLPNNGWFIGIGRGPVSVRATSDNIEAGQGQ